MIGLRLFRMLTSINPHKEDGIIRPRVVAHSLQIAKLLENQKQQAQGSAVAVPYAADGYIIGVVLYFMLQRMLYCQSSQACDPSKAALFHWFDDTMRRVNNLESLTREDLLKLKAERGAFIDWLEKQDHATIMRCAEVLQLISPYDFTVFSIPEKQRMLSEHVQLLDKERYFSLLRHLLQQYLSDGLDCMRLYQEHGQVFEMRLFMRHITTMRTIARGFGNAALLSKDYLAVAESFYFSGDLMQPAIQEEIKSFLQEAQNEYPETCERVLQAIESANHDWFDQFKQIYQASFSLNHLKDS